jgi:hypothetical protein
MRGSKLLCRNSVLHAHLLHQHSLLTTKQTVLEKERKMQILLIIVTLCDKYSGITQVHYEIC